MSGFPGRFEARRRRIRIEHSLPGVQNDHSPARKRGIPVDLAFSATTPRFPAVFVEFASLSQSQPIFSAHVPIFGIPEVQFSFSQLFIGQSRGMGEFPAVYHVDVDRGDSARTVGIRQLHRTHGTGGGYAEPAETVADDGADIGVSAGIDERGVEGDGGKFWRAVRRSEPDDRREPHVAGSRGNQWETPDDPDPVSRFNADLRHSRVQFQFEFDRIVPWGQTHPDRLQRVRDWGTVPRLFPHSA